MAEPVCTSAKDHALDTNGRILEMMARHALGEDGGNDMLNLSVVITVQPPAKARNPKRQRAAATNGEAAAGDGEPSGAGPPPAPPAPLPAPSTCTRELHLFRQSIRNLPLRVGLVALARGEEISVAAMTGTQKATTFDKASDLPTHASTMKAGPGFADAVWGALQVCSCARNAGGCGRCVGGRVCDAWSGSTTA